MYSTDVDLERETLRAVSELGDAVSRVAELAATGGLGALALADLPATVATLVRLADQVDAVATTSVGRLHRSGALPIATTRWLQQHAGQSATAATAAVGFATTLDDEFASARAAWVGGDVTRGQVRALTAGINTAIRSVSAERKDALRAKAEAALLRYAIDGATAADVARRATRVRAIVDPDGMAHDVLEIERAQFVRFTPEADGVSVRGFLSAETHAVIATALQQIVDAQHRTGALPADARIEGDDPATARMRRQRAPHLHALALRELCGRFLESGELGSHHGSVPRVLVTVDLHDLHAHFGAFVHAPGHDQPTHLGHASARRLLCDAEITAALVTGARPRCTREHCQCAQHTGLEPSLDDLLLDASRQVLYLGRAQRIVPPRLRRALEVRDQHCTGPGCRVDVSRTQAHHVQHWEDGGATDIDTLALVCNGCHHLAHEGGWILTPTPDKHPHEHGYWTWTPPPRRRP
jgi:hypothetical protein